jgi:hypothetical protein
MSYGLKELLLYIVWDGKIHYKYSAINYPFATFCKQRLSLFVDT